MQLDATTILSEPPESSTDAARRRCVVGPKEKRRARRRQPTDPLDAPLAERKRRDRGIDGDAKTITGPVVDPSGLLVEALALAERHHEPGAEMLDQTPTPDGPRDQTLDADRLLVRLATRGLGRRRSEQHELPLRRRRHRRASGLDELQPPPVFAPDRLVAHSPAARLRRPGLRWRDSGGEVSMQIRDPLGRQLAATTRAARDHRADPAVLLLASQDPKVLVGHAERARELTEVHPRRLRQRHREDVSRAAVTILDVERADQAAGHDDPALAVALDHAAVGREPAELVSCDRQTQGQRESIHRNPEPRHPLRNSQQTRIDERRLNRSESDRLPRFGRRSGALSQALIAFAIGDLEVLIEEDPIGGRQTLHRLFPGGRLDLDPQTDGVYLARSELLPLAAITENNIGDPAKGRRY
ncbi:MAG TPA: hypothetical protein VK698_28510 [Kofleriaceae bacterium]|nr:hypothetical protein [Kofleriaceae bacterium]